MGSKIFKIKNKTNILVLLNVHQLVNVVEDSLRRVRLEQAEGLELQIWSQLAINQWTWLGTVIDDLVDELVDDVPQPDVGQGELERLLRVQHLREQVLHRI